MSRTPLRLATLAAALLVTAVCSAGEPAPAPSAPAKKPPIYDIYALGKKEIAWKKQVCEQSNRRLFINLGTNDCDACRVVNDALTDKKFQEAFLHQFVPAYVDVSAGSPNLELLKDWKIDVTKGLPAVVILDEHGKFVEATQDGELAHLASKGKDAVQLWVLKRFYADER